jgi:hypothetical protein
MYLYFGYIAILCLLLLILKYFFKRLLSLHNKIIITIHSCLSIIHIPLAISCLFFSIFHIVLYFQPLRFSFGTISLLLLCSNSLLFFFKKNLLLLRLGYIVINYYLVS